MNELSVVIVGAGLAGLAAARTLEHRGCRVTVFDARERPGGRVWTLRNGFGRMHAEAGGEFIDDEHEEIRTLAKDLGCVSLECCAADFRIIELAMMGAAGCDHRPPDGGKPAVL